MQTALTSSWCLPKSDASHLDERDLVSVGEDGRLGGLVATVLGDGDGEASLAGAVLQ